MRRFIGEEFYAELKYFLGILKKRKFDSYMLLKIKLNKPNHSDIDILTTKFSELKKILVKSGYREGKDLRYYKKNRIPIDLHSEVKWNIFAFNTERLMRNRRMIVVRDMKFYYISKWDDFVTKFVHAIYSKAVEIKWKLGKNFVCKE